MTRVALSSRTRAGQDPVVNEERCLENINNNSLMFDCTSTGREVFLYFLHLSALDPSCWLKDFKLSLLLGGTQVTMPFIGK